MPHARPHSAAPTMPHACPWHLRWSSRSATEHTRTQSTSTGPGSGTTLLRTCRCGVPSVLSPRPLAFGPQPLALGTRPPVFQPSALGPQLQPSALGPQRWTLSPRPSALGPWP
eukprot:354133-Chlamydomonas_euryale.AAC.1